MSKFFPNRKNRKEDAATEAAPESAGREARRIPLWQALALPLVSVLVFFLLLEGGLALFGIKPVVKTEDPFVGFSSSAPLFVPSIGPDGRQLMVTAPNKLGYFNKQAFLRDKKPNTYRIFTLGGSTTYGRPYDDKTSFSGWLREFLPAAEQGRNWEVVNAGGISYASYRVAHLMEELVNYQPDLFVIYTGHNEYLEERTYSKIRDMSPLVKETVALLNKTRTWSAMSSIMQEVGLQPQKATPKKETLGDRVDTILDLTIGLDHYRRDDALRDNILEHYRISLERMVTLARSVGAEVIFVTPASSLNDCTPFKSQDTDGVAPETAERSHQLLTEGKELLKQEEWQQALDVLTRAATENPRHAELHYRLGQALLRLGRTDEARAEFVTARDEDVCPLRALTPMRGIVTEVAREQGTGLVDYIDILDRHMQETKGYPIPGEELFLDHVHPTIDGHRLLALALIDEMSERKLVELGSNWGQQAIDRIVARVEGGIDREVHGQALANLARVLLWAGKLEDAARSAEQAMDLAGDIRQVAVDSTSILSSVYVRQGQLEKATQTLYDTLRVAPGAIEVHLKIAENLVEPQLMQLEKAAAHILLVAQQMPSYDRAYEIFGNVMARRGVLDIAYDSLTEALRLNPKNVNAQRTLVWVQKRISDYVPGPHPTRPVLTLYPSQAPHTLKQVRSDGRGNMVTDGIEVEFYENGRTKHFTDVKLGKRFGMDITWDEQGQLLSKKIYNEDVLVDEAPGK